MRSISNDCTIRSHRATLAPAALVLLAGLSLPPLAGPAEARPPRKATAVRHATAAARAVASRPAPVTRLVFGNDEVLASPDEGSGTLVSVAGKAVHRRLIRIRADFIPELIKSAEGL